MASAIIRCSSLQPRGDAAAARQSRPTIFDDAVVGGEEAIKALDTW
jgi:hypothetical protein